MCSAVVFLAAHQMAMYHFFWRCFPATYNAARQNLSRAEETSTLETDTETEEASRKSRWHSMTQAHAPDVPPDLHWSCHVTDGTFCS